MPKTINPISSGDHDPIIVPLTRRMPACWAGIHITASNAGSARLDAVYCCSNRLTPATVSNPGKGHHFFYICKHVRIDLVVALHLTAALASTEAVVSGDCSNLCATSNSVIISIDAFL
jgi:hypothetical protein